jgi:16S rRNA (cytosine1402-N4)-methyltransferase
VPVLVTEAVSLIAPRPDGLYVDCTVGLGGHAAALFSAGAGRLIGLDRDDAALVRTRARLSDAGDRLELVHADYRELPRVLHERGIAAIDGAIADLGVSSLQLDDMARGFSFRHDGPLDMRMDQSTGPTAAELVATADEGTLADVIFQFGEERHARRIARAILRARARGPITRTAELAAVVRQAAGGRGWRRIDPATRTFQAVRIWVNRELDGLEAFLETAVAALHRGGRLVVIAFHSLEDRIVKRAFRRLGSPRERPREERAGMNDVAPVAKVLTRKPMVPSEAEAARNPRSRSARLRAVEKVA